MTNISEIHETNRLYWDTRGSEFLEPVVLPFYGSFITEEKYRLFGDVTGKKMLEIGCGNGRSLLYQAGRQASELWGLDLSAGQLEKAKQNLAERGQSAKLICSPMEQDCGIPANYFDFVYSIYAIGWTTDLEGTFARIASYLKKDGLFIFSWSHPIHRTAAEEGDRLVLNKSYFDDAWYPVAPEFCQGELKLSDRPISAYVNALAKAGFAIEQMIEENDPDILRQADGSGGLALRAKTIPVTFVIKARKQ
ncbi:class I SAM-dependent methyltransferase [Saccharibacillus alkalitolerans]|uniref:Class I SAM-dependent methyltransferase n=1 Tax=Saccharibacillus alkalitolerans TaxID=2705290 RepID=A0ABX0F9V7_9BACL|nr:class I SAM-dependent methyltransferase [Saccharibacillus alkalitolerans]NGZ77716.1 class I SAM-dependent methyltransferase [Saccharibacillus alkalitolerans]